MIEIETLWEWIDERVSALPAEEVRAERAVGRCLAESVRAAQDLPAFDHSSMDGYAFAESHPGECPVVMEVAAGTPAAQTLKPGQAARILTGGEIPGGTLGVVRQEDCTTEDGSVRMRRADSVHAGENIRRRGTIRRAGDVLLDAGSRLEAGGVAFLISAGVSSVRVPRAPVILHLATGSELLEPGAPPEPGKIADSNGPMIEALLGREGCRVERRRLRDEARALDDAVRGFEGDLLLISGGSGPGEYDHTTGALRAAGFGLHASRLNSRPGKPLLFATRDSQIAFGLPGNPLSHWVCFQAFVRRALCRLRGAAAPALEDVYCPEWPVPEGDGRRTWTPAVQRFHEGRHQVDPLPWEHSGDLSPLTSADALLLDSPDSATQLVKAFLL